MLDFWVKQAEGGWIVTVGGRQVLGPFPDKHLLIIAACDMARNQAGPMLATRVIVRDENGAERPAGIFGPKSKGPRPL